MLSDDAETGHVPEVINPRGVFVWESQNFACCLPQTFAVELRSIGQRSIDIEYDQMHRQKRGVRNSSIIALNSSGCSRFGRCAAFTIVTSFAP